jgi:hypothetical protein
LSFASHWEYVCGFLDIEDLQSDFADGHSCSALALACSAVSYPLIYNPLANEHPEQIKHALMLWKDREITVSTVQDARGGHRSIKLKGRVNKSTGREMTAYAAFSSMHWKDDTNKFLKSVMTLSTEDMDMITDLVKTAAKKVMKVEGKASTLTIDNDDNDDNIILYNGSESLEHSTHKDGAGAMWVLQ